MTVTATSMGSGSVLSTSASAAPHDSIPNDSALETTRQGEADSDPSEHARHANCLPYATDDFPVDTIPENSELDPSKSTVITSEQHSNRRQDSHRDSSHHPDAHDAHDNHNGHEEAPENLPFFTPPRQRQRWGDTQIAPHTNWGDIFFDLFYVAAAYNLGTVLSTDPTPIGLLYTAALFFPIMNLWSFKTYYDSRFYHHDDVYHRGYEITLLLALATAVLHIKPVTLLSQPSLYKDMFIYGVGLSTAYFLAIGRLLEVCLCQRYLKTQTGLHPEAYVAALHDFWSYFGTGLVYVSAAVVAGWMFYASTDSTDGPTRTLADAATTKTPMATNHVAVWILLAGSGKNVASYVVRVIMKCKSKTDMKEKSVPINVDYLIHRYGEWIMLMLGESVLSLLVVDIVDTMGYYKAFLFGIVSIIMGQYLHFQSAPSDPDQHAIRRSHVASFVFYWLFQVYSLALIVLGVSYKMSLLELVLVESESSDDGYARRSLGSGVATLRWLAATVNPALDLSTAERQQHIAHLFSGSLSILFACSDAMSLAHRGIRTQIQRCECANTTLKKILLVLLVSCRILLIIFIASLSQMVTDPSQVVAIGMCTIMAQVGIRLVGSYVFHDEEELQLKAMERAIHYTRARIHDRPEYTDSVRAPSEQ